MSSIWFKKSTCISKNYLQARQRTYFIAQEYTMNVKYKDWKLYSLKHICKNTFPSIILGEETPLFRHLETSGCWVYFSFKKKSPPVKASARTFEAIKHLILIIILMVMNLSVNYLNIAWIWLTFQHYYPAITIFYESKFGGATLRTGYHCNTIMNLGLDSDLFLLSLVKSTTCFTELSKHAVKQFHLENE